MKCAIVDDEPLALGLLESYVKKTPMLELCGKYSNAIEAMSGLQHTPVDLLFLDIQMPELNGLDLSKMLDTSHTRIVFTTAFSQYAIDGYKVNALDYLLKPISYPEFVGAVSRAQKWFDIIEGNTTGTQVATSENQSAGLNAQVAGSENQSADLNTASGGYIFVKSDYKLLRVNFDDILYIEGLKDYVKIYLSSQSKPILSLTSMHSLEEVLPISDFFRTHRSYIVNMSKVSVIERGQIVFGDKRVPVSDSYKEHVQTYFSSHLVQGRS